MARLGLGPRWRCVLANEWCAKKAAAYRAMFGPSPELIVGDVARLDHAQVPNRTNLVWASFPCQDLSLAGNGAGLEGTRSGTFKPFWRLIQRKIESANGPSAVVLENVAGTLTSHGGRDFACICDALRCAGFLYGALVIDAIHFLPQSRPRLFIVAIREKEFKGGGFVASGPAAPWHTPALLRAYGRLKPEAASKWVWWRLPAPPARGVTLADLVDSQPSGVEWHTSAQTDRILAMMSSTNLAKVRQIQAAGERRIGAVYRRTRPDPETGISVQRAEVRFDGISGCLRTPAGGSSRQILMEVEGERVQTRLLSAREAARLMGVPESYPIPANYNEAYHLFGDGLAVPAVAWLSNHLLLPLATRELAVEAA